MSIQPCSCEKCKKTCLFLGVDALPDQGGKVSYGVAWGCPSCDYKALDVCPMGPLVPAESICLNCGQPYPSPDPETACGGCNLNRMQVRAFLGLDQPVLDPVAAARDLFGQGLFRRGLALLNLVLQQQPRHENAWLLKCSFLEGIKLSHMALQMLEGALAHGGPLSLEINHASALHRAGRYQESIAASRRYLAAEPQGRWAAAAHTNLGLSLRLLGDEEAAEEEYRQAVELEPGQVLHYRNLAQLLLDQQRWAGALGVLETGLQRAVTPEDRSRFLEGLAFVYAEEERGPQALRYIDQAMALGSDSPRSHYLRGRALALLGRLEEARKETLHVLELEPDNTDARQAMDLIDHALAEEGEKGRHRGKSRS